MYIKSLNYLLRSRIYYKIPFIHNGNHNKIFNKYINSYCNVILLKKENNIFSQRSLIYEVNRIQIKDWNKSLYGFQFIRLKSSKSKKHRGQRDEDIDTDTDEESDDEDEWIIEKGKNFKDKKVLIPSLRLDAVVKGGIGLSRSKAEESFYGGKIKLNNSKPKKKSIMVQVGDLVDVTIKEEGESSEIARFKVLKIGNYEPSKDKFPVLIRRYSKVLPEDLEEDDS
ncbi:UNVERIFIED_CONTAM: hypothetical protein RMT77_007848 [Armadillidium vulgare]